MPTDVFGFFGDIYSAKSAADSQNKANESNERIARENRDFQERMSSSAHQREVSDLRAAGLNPILSAHGGASSPGGSTATMIAKPVPQYGESIRNNVFNREQIKTARTQQILNMSSAKKAEADAGLSKANTDAVTGGYVGVPFSSTRIPVSAFSGKSLTNTPRPEETIRRWTERKRLKSLADEMENRRIK